MSVTAEHDAIPPRGGQFTCAMCGGRFEMSWSDTEARAEAEALWPDELAKGTEMMMVCDDCFQRAMSDE